MDNQSYLKKKESAHAGNFGNMYTLFLSNPGHRGEGPRCLTATLHGLVKMMFSYKKTTPFFV